MHQINGVAAHGRNQRNAQRKHAGEDDADGRILFELCASADRADAHRGQDSSHQPPPEQRCAGSAADQIADRDAGQDRMGQCVAEEGHAAQDHVAAYQRADDPHDHRRGHAAHHERIRERFEEKI